MRRLLSIWVFTVLFISLHPLTSVFAATQNSPNKDEVYGYYLLAHIPSLPPMVPGAFMPINDLTGNFEDEFEGDYYPDIYYSASNAFNAAIQKNKRDARAYLGQAICEERQRLPAEAAEDYKAVLSLDPSNVRARQGLHRAQLFVRIARIAVQDLPKKQNVIQVEPIKVDRRTEWVVLSAGPPDPDDDQAIDSAYVSLFEPRAEHLRRLSLTRFIARGFSDDERAGNDSFQSLFLTVADVDGNGRDQACVFGSESSPPWIEPFQLDLFTPSNGELKKTFEITSNWPIWAQDIDHDGRCEIGVYYEIGDEPRKFEQPRWMDIYAYRHGAYRLENREFPKAYRSMTQILRKALDKYRDDDELWQYLGKAYDIEGEHRRAREAYRRSKMPETINTYQ